MCLYTKSKTPKVAKHDIVCYKIVRMFYNEINHAEPFRSMFYNHRYSVGTEYSAPGILNTEKQDYLVWRTGRFIYEKMYRVERGFHSFSRYEKIGEACTGVYDKEHEEFALKCIIPEGSLYVEGIYGDLCSERLKIVGWQQIAIINSPDSWHDKNPEISETNYDIAIKSYS